MMKTINYQSNTRHYCACLFANKRPFLYLLFLSMTLFSCTDFVEVGLPDSQLTGVKVFEDKNTANAALADVYAKLRDSGILTGSTMGISSRLGLYADELTFYGGSTNSESNFYNNTLLAANSDISNVWNVSYNQIYAVNAIIEGVQKSVALGVADKSQLIGEAKFIRALVHFYLANLYGDIPYITVTDYQVNRLVGRMPVSQVYDQIISDLNDASTLLPEEYRTADRTLPNRSTANALLARVFLYNRSWAEASNSASAVLNSSLYVWETDLDKIFLKESTTTIWQFIPKVEGANTDEGSTFLFSSGPPPFVALSNALVSAFSSGDQRKIHWIGTITSGTNVWHYANKYKEMGFTGSSVEYSIVFRLAEQYLIRAEARAHQGDLIGAKEDLNKIRNTAGLDDTEAITSEEIITAVLAERRLEFFTEQGQRFFDLKRTAQLDATLSGVKVGWNSTDILWPLPSTELIANPNLRPQNAGY
ncbi:RagB/SusD family nutrient uptake outer membrane protein [Flavobacterium gillisiae]|nr:RagB/SusD family nutrient uptake outer membrane protein [Flavobacterium gillisiae]